MTVTQLVKFERFYALRRSTTVYMGNPPTDPLVRQATPVQTHRHDVSPTQQ